MSIAFTVLLKSWQRSEQQSLWCSNIRCRSPRELAHCQVHLTDEQASVLLACGEYWQHGLIPKD
eukprot:888340-Amphidinium_carterae.1